MLESRSDVDVARLSSGTKPPSPSNRLKNLPAAIQKTLHAIRKPRARSAVADHIDALAKAAHVSRGISVPAVSPASRPRPASNAPRWPAWNVRVLARRQAICGSASRPTAFGFASPIIFSNKFHKVSRPCRPPADYGTPICGRLPHPHRQPCHPAPAKPSLDKPGVDR